MRDSRTLTEQEVETLDAFLVRLQRIAEDWRYSDEFLGLVVRQRWPQNYNDDRKYPQRDGR